MEKDFISRRPSGSRKNEPKVMSVVMEEFFRSNEPMAVAFRHRKAYANTELNVDLKLLTQKPGRMPVGAYLNGVIAHDKEDRYVFTETPLQAAGKRNPRVFNGQFITITRWDDGSYHPNFKAMRVDEDFDIGSYAIGVCLELCEALKGLIEEE